MRNESTNAPHSDGLICSSDDEELANAAGDESDVSEGVTSVVSPSKHSHEFVLTEIVHLLIVGLLPGEELDDLDTGDYERRQGISFPAPRSK